MDFLNSLIIFKQNFQFLSYSYTSLVIDFFISFIVCIDNTIILIMDFLEIVTYFNLSHGSISLVLTSIKFLLCISLLIFARGGIPRFRFDYLTKLG